MVPRELTQISPSSVTELNLTNPGAARYFDYASAVVLRNLQPPAAPMCPTALGGLAVGRSIPFERTIQVKCEYRRIQAVAFLNHGRSHCNVIINEE